MAFFDERYRVRVKSHFLGDALEWVEGVPGLLDECETRWNLRVLAPFDLSYNYVAPVLRADGSEAVIKVCLPGKEALTEMETLRACDGRGMVRLLEWDEAGRVMLLERLRPGRMLSEIGDIDHDPAADEAATRIAADVLSEMWSQEDHLAEGQGERLPEGQGEGIPWQEDDPRFVSVADWARGLARLRQQYHGGTGPLDAGLVGRAEGLFADLLASRKPPVLLHGDFHHFNILADERSPLGWKAIDPKGVLGEAEFEISAFQLNIWDDLPAPAELRRRLLRRTDLFSERLGLDRERVNGWTIARAVLSAWWTVEDHGESALKGNHAIPIAQALIAE